jgi:hypothetical protein
MHQSIHLLQGEQPYLDDRSRRQLRGRNHLVGNDYLDRCSHVTAIFREILISSLAKGASAAREIAVPAIVVQAAMLTLAIGYFYSPTVTHFLQGLVDLKNKVGTPFAFLSMGSIAVIAEILRRMTARSGWSGFGSSAAFGFATFGMLGVCTDLFYVIQKALWHGLPATEQVVAKVMTDQFFYTVLFANPYQTFLYVFKDCGFRPVRFAERISPFRTFYVREMLAVLITNWAFWIPTTAIIYSLPLDLQFVISRLAIMIWVLILTTMTKR